MRGLNLGIDFEGGTQWQFTSSNGSVSVNDVRDVLGPLGLGDAKVLILGNDSVRVQSEDLPLAKQQEVSQALAKYAEHRRAVGADQRTSARPGVTRSATRHCKRCSCSSS